MRASQKKQKKRKDKLTSAKKQSPVLPELIRPKTWPGIRSNVWQPVRLKVFPATGRCSRWGVWKSRSRDSLSSQRWLARMERQRETHAPPRSPSCPPERDARMRRMEGGGWRNWIYQYVFLRYCQHMDALGNEKKKRSRAEKNVLAREEEADKVQHSSAHQMSWSIKGVLSSGKKTSHGDTPFCSSHSTLPWEPPLPA